MNAWYAADASATAAQLDHLSSCVQQWWARATRQHQQDAHSSIACRCLAQGLKLHDSGALLSGCAHTVCHQLMKLPAYPAACCLTPQGANGQFDFFVGEGSSVIFADNVTRNRVSCTDPPQAAKLVERTQRSPRFLGPEGMKQMYSEGNLNFRGQLFPSTLHLLNYSAEFPKHYNGGYTVVSVVCAQVPSSLALPCLALPWVVGVVVADVHCLSRVRHLVKNCWVTSSMHCAGHMQRHMQRHMRSGPTALSSACMQCIPSCL
jgi:hypothetical protein